MRHRAGIILIEDNKVALIERHRAGLHYFVFPGGGVDEGEIPEQAAIREAEEELGVRVAIKQKVAEVYIEQNVQFYYLVECVGGEFGTGSGEEVTDADPNDPNEGIYDPIWMPIDELVRRENVYPADLPALVAKSLEEGWQKEPVKFVEVPKYKIN